MKVRMLALLARVGAPLACAALLASCGGGGGGDATVQPPAPVSASLYAGLLQTPGSRDGTGVAAQFNGPADVAQDAAGNVYVADGNHTIRRISPTGTVTTLAGSAGQAGSVDGIGADARFSDPRGVAVDAAGNVYVSDTGNSTLRRISPAGVVTTIAGAPGQPGSTDGDAASARFRTPLSLAVDGEGAIYVVDDQAVRKLSPDGRVTTFAGKAGDHETAVTGNAADTRFDRLSSVAVDGSGNVYVADIGLAMGPAQNIRKFDSQGQALPFGPAADGLLMTPFPVDISADAAGNVYVVSSGRSGLPEPRPGGTYQLVSRITPDGMSSTTLAGVINDVRTVDGPVAVARFANALAVAVGPNGRVAVAEGSTSAIRLIDTQQGIVTTLAGGFGAGEVDGPAAVARFNGAAGLAAGPDGTLYVADVLNNSVRKISVTGVVSTLARGLFHPGNIALGPDGTVYAVGGNTAANVSSVYAIAPDGTVTDRLGTTSRAIATDAAGTVYLSEGDPAFQAEAGRVFAYAPDRSKRVLATGVSARILAADAAGNMYFVGPDFAAIHVIRPSGELTVLAGRPDQPGDDDGVAQQARFRAIRGLTLDATGNLYASDGSRIRRITPQGAVTTVAEVSLLPVAQAGLGVTSLTAVGPLAWSAGALYATVRNSVIRIAPVN